MKKRKLLRTAQQAGKIASAGLDLVGRERVNRLADRFVFSKLDALLERSAGEPRCYDATRELLSAQPYPGDAPPDLRIVLDYPESDFRLSRVELSVHAGTHMDAPLHYLENGSDAAALPLEACVGDCLVLDAADLPALSAARKGRGAVPPRLILRGAPNLSGERLDALLALRPLLVGTDALSVDEADGEKAAHIALLTQNIVVLENLDLTGVPNGRFRLCALPLKLAGAEAAPCRVLFFQGKEKDQKKAICGEQGNAKK